MKLCKSLAIGLLGISAAVFTASAFTPFEPGHPAITRDALTVVTRDVDGQTLRFSARAIDQIIASNKDTDCGGSVACLCKSCQKDSSRHFDNEQFTDSTSRLIGFQEAIISDIRDPFTSRGANARRTLGEALHTIQDFYAHSNWIVLRNIIDTRLGRERINQGDLGSPPTADFDTLTCPNDPAQLEVDGHTHLTTGYFRVNDLCVNEGSLPTGKCIHGDFAIDGCGGQGISKDKPGRGGYDQARNLATQASIDFINQILDDPRVAGNARAIKALMDVQGRSLTVVIDNTDAPAGVILSLHKAQIGNIVNRLAGSGDDPTNYVLVPYNDVGASPAFVTANASQFLAAVNALQPHQAMQCPRRSMAALQQAVVASEDDSSIFLFADMDTVADTSLVSSVIGSAQGKGIKISPLIFGGSCTGVIPPEYGRVAAETGGHLLHLFADTSVFPLIFPHVASDPGDVLSESGTVNGDVREFTFSLRPGLETAALYVVFDPLASRGTTELIRPFGELAQDSDPDVTFDGLDFDGLAINVNSPQPGLWRLRVSGFGNFETEAIAKTVGVNRFEFVTLAGRPGHEGLFPIHGQPVGSGPHTVLANLGGPIDTASFRLVDLQGNTLQTVQLAQGDPNAGPGEFTGTFELPTQTFQAAVSGDLTDGTRYERLFPQVFRVQSVEVTHSITFDDVPAGATTSTFFTVRNAGAAGNFNISAVDSQGFISAVVPGSVALGTGASATVRVDFTVPLAAALGSETHLALRATSTINPVITNTATASLTVGNPVPAITGLSPASALAGHFGFTLTVTGANFLADSLVRWNGAARPTTFVSATELQAAIADTDIAAPGTASVTVFNLEPAGGVSNAVAFAINGVTPVLSSLSPSFAAPGDPAFTLTVNGQNFVASSVVRWNGSNRATLFVSQTQLQASIPATDLQCICTVQVTAFTPNVGASNALPFSVFRNPLPTVTGLSPTGVVAGNPSFTLTVNGSNFVSGAVVRWNGANRTTTFVNSGQLQATIPAGDVGTQGSGQVTAFNPAPGGGTSNALTFAINQAPNPVPQVSSLNPNNVVAGEVRDVFTFAVNGSSFISGSVVRWNGQNRTTSFGSATQLQATIPASDVASAGTAQVTVFTPTPGGGTSNASTFTINNPVPALSSLSPSGATAGDPAFTLTVVGSSFIPGAVVRWNGSNRTTTYVGNSQLRATITMADIGSEGTALVTVFNPGPGGGVSNVLTFTIVSPPPPPPDPLCQPKMPCE